MESPIPVTIPLLNPNEPEALLVSISVEEGQQVSQGDLLCSLETTKSAADVFAESGGYIAGLRLEAGQTVRAGDLLCYLAPSPEWKPEEAPLPLAEPAPAPSGSPHPGLRITQPALNLARQNNLELSLLPIGPLVTESMVRALLEKRQSPAPAADHLPASFDPTRLLIYGGGGHAKMLIDLLHGLNLYQIEGILDDRLPAGTEILGVPVIGGGERLDEIAARGVRLALNAVAGIGNVELRIRVFRRLAEAGYAFPAVTHTRAVVERSAILESGSQVFALAYVGSQARVGFGAIVNTGAIVSHDCQIGPYAAISPGAILAGETVIGAGALIGMGATVNLRVKVGAGARIGNGATVKADVPERGLVRAGTIWPPDS